MADGKQRNHALDAEFCEHHCPICTRARRGVWWARALQAVELVLTFGGCPAGRDRRRVYGVRPNEARPAEQPPTE